MCHRILVTGSIAHDLLLHYQGSFADGLSGDLADLSVAFTTQHFAKQYGGNGATISWTLALLRQESLLVGTVGWDGEEYRDLLQKRGIDVTHVEERDDDVTSTAIMGTDSAARQIMFFHPGADAKGIWPNLLEERDSLRYAIVSPRDIRIQMQAVIWCHAHGLPCLFDPGQCMPSYSRDELLRTLRLSAGFIANDYEWSLCANVLRMSMDDVLQMVEYVVVTHGGEGFTVYTRAGTEVLPACRANHVVDPTGAGDAFRAGFLTGLIGGWSLADSGKLGAAIASKVVEKQGTLLDSLDLNEVMNRAAVAYGKELPALPIPVVKS